MKFMALYGTIYYIYVCVCACVILSPFTFEHTRHFSSQQSPQYHILLLTQNVKILSAILGQQ